MHRSRGILSHNASRASQRLRGIRPEFPELNLPTQPVRRQARDNLANIAQSQQSAGAEAPVHAAQVEDNDSLNVFQLLARDSFPAEQWFQHLPADAAADNVIAEQQRPDIAVAALDTRHNDAADAQGQQAAAVAERLQHLGQQQQRDAAAAVDRVLRQQQQQFEEEQRQQESLQLNQAQQLQFQIQQLRLQQREAQDALRQTQQQQHELLQQQQQQRAQEELRQQQQQQAETQRQREIQEAQLQVQRAQQQQQEIEQQRIEAQHRQQQQEQQLQQQRAALQRQIDQLAETARQREEHERLAHAEANLELQRLQAAQAQAQLQAQQEDFELQLAQQVAEVELQRLNRARQVAERQLLDSVAAATAAARTTSVTATAPLVTTAFSTSHLQTAARPTSVVSLPTFTTTTVQPIVITPIVTPVVTPVTQAIAPTTELVRQPISIGGMSKSALSPPEPYKGDKSQDAKDWLATLNFWVDFRNIPPLEAAKMFPVLLRETAIVWFQTLDAATRNNWTALQAAFVARFQHPQHIQWQDTTDVFSYKQSAQETVDEYIAVMLKKISRVTDLSIRNQIHAVISGLRPELRQHVIQHTCDSIEEVRRWATIAETATPVTTANVDVVNALKTMQERIDLLTQHHVVAALKPPQQQQLQPPTQYVQQQPQLQQNYGQQGQQRYRNNPRTYSNSNRQPNTYQPQQQQQPFQNLHAQQQFMQQQFAPQQSHASPHVAGTTTINTQNNTTQNTCNFCGLVHRFANFCPATGKQCTRCFGYNHFGRMCTAVPTYNSPQQYQQQ